MYSRRSENQCVCTCALHATRLDVSQMHVRTCICNVRWVQDTVYYCYIPQSSREISPLMGAVDLVTTHTRTYCDCLENSTTYIITHLYLHDYMPLAPMYTPPPQHTCIYACEPHVEGHVLTTKAVLHTFRLLPSKGSDPLTSVYRITPRLHTSTSGPSYFFPWNSSGAA